MKYEFHTQLTQNVKILAKKVPEIPKNLNGSNMAQNMLETDQKNSSAGLFCKWDPVALLAQL